MKSQTGECAVRLLDRVKGSLSQATAQIGQAGKEIHAEMRLERVRRWLEHPSAAVTPMRVIEELEAILHIDSRVAAEAHRLLAHQLAEQGDLGRAAVHLQSAISIMTTDAPATVRDWIAEKLQLREDEYLRELYLELAALCEQQQKWEEALAAAQLALEWDARNLTAYHTAIHSLLQMGQTDHAERMILRAQTFDAAGLVEGWVEEFVKLGLLPEG